MESHLYQSQLLCRHLQAAKRCRQVYYESESNVSLHVDRSRRNAILAVKGTSTPHHWQNNLMMGVNDLQAHKGFWKYARECVADLRKAHPKFVKEELLEGGRLCMTAHSSGSAALTMCLYEMMRNHEIRNLLRNWEIELVMFGSPRPGKKPFVHEFNRLLRENEHVQVYRYEVSMDIASGFPPIPGYKHVGGHYLELKAHPLGDPYANHSISNYIQNMEFLIESEEERSN